MAALAVVPRTLLAPFSADTRRMIEEECDADPAFGERVAMALSAPGGAIYVANWARRAVANELNPRMYPETRGQWPRLRALTSSMAETAMREVDARVAAMSLDDRTRVMEAVASQGVHGMGQLGQAGGASTLSVVGGVAGAVVGAVAAVYTAKVISSAQKQIAQIQSTAAIHQADVQLQIARANAAMAQAQAVINAQQGGMSTTMPWTVAQPVTGQPAARPGTAETALPDPLKAALPAAIVGGGALLYAVLSGLGPEELEAFRRLPSTIQEHLVDEAEDPSFVPGYLGPALRTPDPYGTIVSDMARAMARDEMGSFAVGDLGRSFFKKLAKFERRIRKKVTPKFIAKIQKKVHLGAKKIWHQYGGIIIGVVGAILAPFTGGASLIAASILTAAKQMYDAKKAAHEATKAAKADATQQNAQANAQQREVSKQVEDFYRQNQAWFLQHDITPDKWKKLTLDQKIGIINAGANGTLPPGATPLPPAQQAALNAQVPGPSAAPAGVPAGGGGGGPPAGGPSGGGGGAPSGGAPSPDGGSPGPQEPGPAQEQGAPQKAETSGGGSVLPVLGAVALIGLAVVGGGGKKK